MSIDVIGFLPNTDECNKEKKRNTKKMQVRIQPWWLIGLICHISNSSRNGRLGPDFETRSRHFSQK